MLFKPKPAIRLTTYIVIIALCLICTAPVFYVATQVCDWGGTDFTEPPKVIVPDTTITASNATKLELIAETRQFARRPIVFSDDSSLLLAGNGSGVIVWDVSTGGRTDYFEHLETGWGCKIEINIHSSFESLGGFAVNSDGSLLVSDSAEVGPGMTESLSLKLWDIREGELIRIIEQHNQLPYSLTFLPGDNTLIYFTRDAQTPIVRVLDVKTNEEIVAFHEPDILPFLEVILAGDAIVFATRNAIKIGYLDTGLTQTLLEYDPMAMWENQFRVSPDGSLITTWNRDEGKITIWDAQQLDEINTFEVEDSRIASVAFSPDAKWMVVNVYDNSYGTSFLVWNLEKEGSPQIIRTNKHNVDVPAFSADSTLIAYSKNDGVIRLWDLTKFQEIAVLELPSQSEYTTLYPVFSPDGKLLAATNEGSIFLWGIPD